VKPAPAPARSRPIKLSDREAAGIASQELGRRVPPATVRSWKNRDKVAGGRGWIDGASLVVHLELLSAGARTQPLSTISSA
jgi:hypothetical protein